MAFCCQRTNHRTGSDIQRMQPDSGINDPLPRRSPSPVFQFRGAEAPHHALLLAAVVGFTVRTGTMQVSNGLANVLIWGNAAVGPVPVRPIW